MASAIAAASSSLGTRPESGSSLRDTARVSTFAPRILDMRSAISAWLCPAFRRCSLFRRAKASACRLVGPPLPLRALVLGIGPGHLRGPGSPGARSRTRASSAGPDGTRRACATSRQQMRSSCWGRPLQGTRRTRSGRRSNVSLHHLPRRPPVDNCGVAGGGDPTLKGRAADRWA